MRRGFFGIVAGVLVLALAGAVTPVRAADHFKVDSVHSSISFKVSHLNLSQIHGRFDNFTGAFTVDKDNPANTSFEFSINAESIDTNNPKRDGHLRSGDFFNVKQFPAITFKSTSVRPVDGGYEVAGDLTMHGVTKPITAVLKGGGSNNAMGPRTGFAGDFTIKRSDFGVGLAKFAGMLGDEVAVSVGFEAVKQK